MFFGGFPFFNSGDGHEEFGKVIFMLKMLFVSILLKKYSFLLCISYKFLKIHLTYRNTEWQGERH